MRWKPLLGQVSRQGCGRRDRKRRKRALCRGLAARKGPLDGRFLRSPGCQGLRPPRLPPNPGARLTFLKNAGGALVGQPLGVHSCPMGSSGFGSSSGTAFARAVRI